MDPLITTQVTIPKDVSSRAAHMPTSGFKRSRTVCASLIFNFVCVAGWFDHRKGRPED